MAESTDEEASSEEEESSIASTDASLLASASSMTDEASLEVSPSFVRLAVVLQAARIKDRDKAAISFLVIRKKWK
jgi:hypothetical protein